MTAGWALPVGVWDASPWRGKHYCSPKRLLVQVGTRQPPRSLKAPLQGPFGSHLSPLSLSIPGGKVHKAGMQLHARGMGWGSEQERARADRRWPFNGVDRGGLQASGGPEQGPQLRPGCRWVGLRGTDNHLWVKAASSAERPQGLDGYSHVTQDPTGQGGDLPSG